MSWWMWVLLWSGLVAAAAVVLGVLAWSVWRRFAGAARELGKLGASVEQMDRRLSQDEQPRTRAVDAPRAPDVFTPYGQARLKYREDSHRRRSERVERRLARRARRAQPQRVQDPRAARGKELRNG